MIFCLILSLVGCKQDKPDAYRCVLITKDSQGGTARLEDWYAYCKNMDNEDVKRISIYDLDKGLVNPTVPSKWILTDLDNYDRAKKFYEEQCGGSW